MRSRTLERLRWLSVLCLIGAAICFALVERRARAFERSSAHFPSPAPGAPVKAMVDVAGPARYQLQMRMPMPAASRNLLHMPELSAQPAGLRIAIDPRDGTAKTVDIPRLVFCSEYTWGGIAIYCSELFELSPGPREIEVSIADDALPPGRALDLVEVAPLSVADIAQGLVRFLGWLAFAAGLALWMALAFARRYAPSDAAR